MLPHHRQPGLGCDPTAGSPCLGPPPPGEGSSGVVESLMEGEQLKGDDEEKKYFI